MIVNLFVVIVLDLRLEETCGAFVVGLGSTNPSAFLHSEQR
jgi:hypothetical protein